MFSTDSFSVTQIRSGKIAKKTEDSLTVCQLSTFDIFTLRWALALKSNSLEDYTVVKERPIASRCKALISRYQRYVQASNA